MRIKAPALAIMALLIAAFVAMPLTAAAAPPSAATASFDATATGTSLVDGSAQTVEGTVSNLVFSTNQAGQLVVSGVFIPAGATVGQAFTAIVDLTQSTGTCDILHLELGPIDLDLLGLLVHVDKIVIDIDAQSGPGNLLGNLLCGIAGLLDANGPTNVLARLLNQLLGLLG